MLTLKLSKDVEKRLSVLAQETGRTKDALAEDAIREMLQDHRDLEDAKEIVARGYNPCPSKMC